MVCGMSFDAVKQSESICALVVRGFEFEFGKLSQEFPSSTDIITHLCS